MDQGKGWVRHLVVAAAALALSSHKGGGQLAELAGGWFAIGGYVLLAPLADRACLALTVIER